MGLKNLECRRLLGQLGGQGLLKLPPLLGPPFAGAAPDPPQRRRRAAAGDQRMGGRLGAVAVGVGARRPRAHGGQPALWSSSRGSPLNRSVGSLQGRELLLTPPDRTPLLPVRASPSTRPLDVCLAVLCGRPHHERHWKAPLDSLSALSHAAVRRRSRPRNGKTLRPWLRKSFKTHSPQRPPQCARLPSNVPNRSDPCARHLPAPELLRAGSLHVEF